MEKKKKSAAEQLHEELFIEKKCGYDIIDEKTVAEIQSYSADYMAYLDASKTEREAVDTAIAQAEKLGFKPYVRGMAVKPGDKIYRNNRGKSLMLAIIGKKPLDAGVNIGAAHIDSPRLDIKPYPLFEDGEFCLMKTHYYGGIRKYQWLSIPLEICGVVVRKDGTSVKVNIGREPGDPKLVIPDLLPHLAQNQASKPLATAVDAEKLHLFAGSRPYGDKEVKDRLKLAILEILNKRYGITEEDFLSAELSAVPAFNASDIGIDASMIGAYGQDDRVCGYASLRALFDTKKPERTAICVLADKEEIGSVGVTGMQSDAFDFFVKDLCEAQGVNVLTCYENSFCLSADVSACFDPDFAEVYDVRNTSIVNQGVSICKYTGSRGKSGASDASAEVMARVRKMFSENKVVWNVTELGKVDAGGGGTVAAYMANRNIDTVDAGVPVLGMHSPFEVTAKLDCYMCYKAMKAVYNS